MNRFILITTVILIVFQTKAQNFEENFLGEDFMLYKNVLFKIDEHAILGFDNSFYSDLKNCQKPLDNNVIYSSLKHKYLTEKDSLINRIFITENIIEKNGQEWSELSNMSVTNCPILVLRDTLTKQKIYFVYSSKYENVFPFKTSKINYSDQYFSNKIEREVDDFTSEIKLNSPSIENNQILPLVIYKYIKNGKPIYYLSLTTNGSTVNINQKDITVLFDDGSKWSRQSKIDLEATSNGYQYSSFITLNVSDLSIFSSKSIKKFRLYIYDQEISSNESNKFKLFVKSIKDLK